MLAPAGGFYGTPGLGKKEVRLAYVLNSEDLNKAMDCLGKALGSISRRNFYAAPREIAAQSLQMDIDIMPDKPTLFIILLKSGLANICVRNPDINGLF
jgi:hypothetical protein